jgi:hypothetical protein
VLVPGSNARRIYHDALMAFVTSSPDDAYTLARIGDSEKSR